MTEPKEWNFIGTNGNGVPVAPIPWNKDGPKVAQIWLTEEKRNCCRMRIATFGFTE